MPTIEKESLIGKRVPKMDAPEKAAGYHVGDGVNDDQLKPGSGFDRNAGSSFLNGITRPPENGIGIYWNRKRFFSKFLILPPMISIPSALSILIFFWIEIPDVCPSNPPIRPDEETTRCHGTSGA